MIADSIATPPRTVGTVQPRTILILDPHRDSRIVFGTVLGHHGYRVVEASDHTSGIQLMRHEQPDLALVEFEGCPKHPCELAAGLRAAATPKIPILIAVSAWALSAEREAALACGFDAFHAKPISLRHLLTEVQRWLAMPAPVRE